MELLVIVMIAFIVMTLAVLGMATGVLFGRNPIRGSCGGLNKRAGLCACAEPCEKRKRALQSFAEQDR